MIELPYSLVVEATDDPTFFGFYSPDLEGFTGIGSSIADCLEQAPAAMSEFVDFLREGLIPVPPTSDDPTITIRNQPKATAA